MDQTELQQQIAEYYLRLPKDAQISFATMKWMDTLKVISAKYTLSNQQIESLGTETTLVLLGIISIEQYTQVLFEEINLPQDAIEKMIGEIEDGILKNVRPDLEQAYEGNLKIVEQESKIENLDPRFDTLPKELQEAIALSDWQKKLYEVAAKYKLSIAQMAKLEEATIRFMNGKISPSQYENSLTVDVELDSGKARELATDINGSIMLTIRNSMKNTGAETLKTEDAVPVPPYATTKISNISQSNPADKTDLYKQEGIEILDEENRSTESVPMPSQTKESGIDLIKQKLEGITATKTAVSDHTLPKISTNDTPPSGKGVEDSKKDHDLYREAVE
jgi:hypothetical protein